MNRLSISVVILSFCLSSALTRLIAAGKDQNRSKPSLNNFYQRVIEPLRAVQSQLGAWSKLEFKGSNTLWVPSYYLEDTVSKMENPKVWLSSIEQMEFCKPDKKWKSMPVMYADSTFGNRFSKSLATLVTSKPGLAYYKSSVMRSVTLNGKTRSVSYELEQNKNKEGNWLANLNCSARNEDGEVQNIHQTFDLSNPKDFDVEQTIRKKNGQIIKI